MIPENRTTFKVWTNSNKPDFYYVDIENISVRPDELKKLINYIVSNYGT